MPWLEHRKVSQQEQASKKENRTEKAKNDDAYGPLEFGHRRVRIQQRPIALQEHDDGREARDRCEPIG